MSESALRKTGHLAIGDAGADGPGVAASERRQARATGSDGREDHGVIDPPRDSKAVMPEALVGPVSTVPATDIPPARAAAIGDS